jgi:hypothetical protein
LGDPHPDERFLRDYALSAHTAATLSDAMYSHWPRYDPRIPVAMQNLEVRLDIAGITWTLIRQSIRYSRTGQLIAGYFIICYHI